MPKKLGIKEGHRLTLLAAPKGFRATLSALPGGVCIATRLGAEPQDVIVLFVTERAVLAREFRRAGRSLDPAGGLWVAWPKRASGVATDVQEGVVREIALGAGLVDNKVCAIDQTWSGLRCVVRLVDRPGGRSKATRAKRA